MNTSKYDINVEFVGLSPSTDLEMMTILPSEVLFWITEEGKWNANSEDNKRMAARSDRSF